MSGRGARRAAAAAVLSAALSAGPATADDRPLNNEDIVRLVAHGTSEKAILDAIATRPADFDLEPGVVEELKVAGVGERILAAMRRRQAVMPRIPPPPPVEPPPDAAPAGAVEVVLDRGGDGGDPILAVRSLPQGVERPGGMEVGRATDLAFAILCTTPEHVRDHWQTRTPIEGGPRHEVVLFRPGSRPGKVRGFEVLFLSEDPIEPVPIALGTHDLVLGLAGQVAGSRFWRLMAADHVRVTVGPGAPARIRVEARSRLRGNRMAGFAIDQDWKASVAAPEGAP